MPDFNVPRRVLLPAGGDASLKEAITRRDQELSTSLNNIGATFKSDKFNYPKLVEPGWKDMIGDIQVKGTPGANSPSWASITSLGGLCAYQFHPTTMNEVWVNWHLDHDLLTYADAVALGDSTLSKIYLHAHWLNAAATPNTGTVRWGFEYTIARGHQTEAFPAPTTVYVTQNCSATRYMHHIAEISATDAVAGASIDVDALILCRIFRDAANDTCSDPVYLLLADCHYRVNRISTKNKSPDFNI